MARFTKIPENAFQEIQLNAGVLLSAFDVDTPPTEETMLANIIGATSGGVNFTATPTFTDFGEDIDNCPKNVKCICAILREVCGAARIGRFTPLTIA